jgi:hypothetical protein
LFYFNIKTQINIKTIYLNLVFILKVFKIEKKGSKKMELKKKEKKPLNEYNIIFKKRDYKNSPTGINIYTVGLRKNYNHPDIQIVLDLKKEIIENIIKKCIEKIKSGGEFLTDIIYDDILPNDYKILFKEKVIKGKKIYRLIFSDHYNKICEEDMHYDFIKQYK